MSRRIMAAALAGLVVTVGLAAPAEAAPPKRYKNCAALLKAYPNGVAKSKAAASKSVKAGNSKPAVAAALYKLNSAKLDRDNDGVMCQQTAEPKTVELKAGWGYLRVPEVAAPKPGECATIPLTFDVRNPKNLGLGLIIELKDDFGNIVAENRETRELPNGITSDTAMTVCSYAWTQPPYIPTGIGIDLMPAATGTYILKATVVTFGGMIAPSAEYTLL